MTFLWEPACMKQSLLHSLLSSHKYTIGCQLFQNFVLGVPTSHSEDLTGTTPRVPHGEFQQVFCFQTLYDILVQILCSHLLECVWNVMAHVQKSDFVFCRNGWVHLNQWGRQFSWLLAAEVCASAVVMLDTPSSEVVWEYWLTTPFASFPFTSPSVCHLCHQVSNALYYCVKVQSCLHEWTPCHEDIWKSGGIYSCILRFGTKWIQEVRCATVRKELQAPKRQEEKYATEPIWML